MSVLFYALNTYFLVGVTLSNLGLPILRYQKLFFLLIPILLLVWPKGIKKASSAHYFIGFILVFYILEYFVHSSVVSSIFDYDLVNRWFHITIIFLGLMTANFDTYITTIKSCLVLHLINCVILYLGLFGVIESVGLDFGSGVWENRLDSVQNMNIYCDMSVFSCYLLYFLKEAKPSEYNYLTQIGYCLIFLPIIFFQGARGSLVLAVPLILLILKPVLVLRFSKKSIYLLVLTVLVIMFSLVVDVSFTPWERLATSAKDIEDDGRYFRVLYSWWNFLSSPVYGVGYSNAAKGFLEGINRANFQYTQILASGGVVLFIVYFSMIFKYFGVSLFKFRSNKIIGFSLYYVLILFTFRRPEYYLAVLMVISSYQSLREDHASSYNR